MTPFFRFPASANEAALEPLPCLRFTVSACDGGGMGPAAMDDSGWSQLVAVSIFAVMIAVMVSGRLRFDIVAALALLSGVAGGIVPFDAAFNGFSDDVVIIIAGALVVSRAVARAGLADRMVRHSLVWLKSPRRQVTVLSAIVMLLSAFIKNVGALSMAIPAAYQFARRTGTPPSALLMPMAFASLLGGITTLVGTSPNLIVSRVREDMLGSGFGMFDFMLVGLPLAAGGLLVLAYGYRLLPVRNPPDIAGMLARQSYRIEAIVTEESRVAGSLPGNLSNCRRELLRSSPSSAVSTPASPIPSSSC